MHNDFGFRFDSIVVIESLRTGELLTGTQLYQDVLVPIAYRSYPADSRPLLELHQPKTKSAFLDCLAQVSRWCIEGRHSPVLHVECHGGDDLLESGSGETIPWDELRDPLISINKASRMNLLVTLGACRGLALAKTLTPTNPAPATIIIGPDSDVSAGLIARGYQAFYEILLGDLDAGEAYKALRGYTSNNRPVFGALPARLVFLYVLSRYFQRHTSSEAILHRSNAILGRIGALTNVDPPTRSVQRDHVQTLLLDRRGTLEAYKRLFFMLDLFPENRSRFDVTIEECEDNINQLLQQ